MFGIGDTEFVLILIVAFLLFGPDKLPSMGRTIGRGIRQFRQASDSVTKVVKSEVIDPISQSASATAAGVSSAVGAAASTSAQAPVTPKQDKANLADRSKETFAERRARLAAEKAAKVAEAAEGSAPARAEAASEADAPAATVEVEERVVEEEPEAPSIASIWGLSEADDDEPESELESESGADPEPSVGPEAEEA